MVNAKLHIICGNCGSTELFYDKKDHCIKCTDCITIHDLTEFKSS